jgi:hypothetical protein
VGLLRASAPNAGGRRRAAESFQELQKSFQDLQESLQEVLTTVQKGFAAQAEVNQDVKKELKDIKKELRAVQTDQGVLLEAAVARTALEAIPGSGPPRELRDARSVAEVVAPGSIAEGEELLLDFLMEDDVRLWAGDGEPSLARGHVDRDLRAAWARAVGSEASCSAGASDPSHGPALAPQRAYNALLKRMGIDAAGDVLAQLDKASAKANEGLQRQLAEVREYAEAGDDDAARRRIASGWAVAGLAALLTDGSRCDQLQLDGCGVVQVDDQVDKLTSSRSRYLLQVCLCVCGTSACGAVLCLIASGITCRPLLACTHGRTQPPAPRACHNDKGHL